MDGLIVEFGVKKLGEYKFREVTRDEFMVECEAKMAELREDLTNKYDGDFYNEDKYVDKREDFKYNTDVVTSHHDVCKADLFSNACNECT